MTEIDAKIVAQLRSQTGAPIKDCKSALVESKGDLKLAVDVLRKRGIKAAEGLSDRAASEGLVFSYIHHNGKIGVLAEVCCETDFVAKNAEFLDFGKKLVQHIAASLTLRYLDRAAVEPAVLEKEKEIAFEQTKASMPGKPQQVIDKAVEGRVAKFFAEACLLDQPWVHDGAFTVEQVLKQLAGKMGENMRIRRFARFDMRQA